MTTTVSTKLGSLGNEVIAQTNPVTGGLELLAPTGYLLGDGVRTVLFGDSMTSQYNVDTMPTASYDTATGILTLTSASHGLATGFTVLLFNRYYTSLLHGKNYQITRTGTNTYTVQLVMADHTDLPNGSLAGSTYARVLSRRSNNGWVTWLMAKMGQRLNIVNNGAQSGDTVQDCLDRLTADCLSYGPTLVLMQLPGINDMSTSSGPIDEETIYTKQKQLITSILATGARLVCLSMTPVASGEARGNLQTMEKVQRLTRRMATFCQTLNNVAFIDAARRIVDAADTTGYALAGYLKSTDKIHYCIPGARYIASVVYSAIDSWFPGDLTSLPTSTIACMGNSAATLTNVSRTSGVISATSVAHNFLSGEYVRIYGGTSEVLSGWGTVTRTGADTLNIPYAGADGSITGTIKLSRSNNMFPNPLLITATGGTLVGASTTGVAASGVKAGVLSGTGTAVSSVVAHPNGYGNINRLVVSDATAGACLGYECSQTIMNPFVAVPGREYEFEAYFKVSSADWSKTIVDELKFRLVVNMDGGTLHSVFGADTYDGLPATGSLTSDMTETHWKTPKMTLPGGTVTALYWQAYIQCKTGWSATNLTVDIGQIRVAETIGE